MLNNLNPFIVIANFSYLQIDYEYWFTDFTIGFIGRRLGVIWPPLYYHLLVLDRSTLESF